MRWNVLVRLAAIFVAIQYTACTQGWGKFWENKPVVVFDAANYWFYQNAPINAVTPVVTGDFTMCSISPALPGGLFFNSKTCGISGTPTALLGLTQFSVTASNSTSSATGTVSLRVANNTATRVYGQTSFTTGTANPVSSGSLSQASGGCADSSGVYVADYNYNRVLFYPGTSTVATRVYGQGGSFTASLTNNGGVSANSLSLPYSVATDSQGVYIADAGNNRVLYFPGQATTATRVYGQNGSFTSVAGGTSASALNNPSGIFHDGNGLFVTDASNHRVLYFAGTATTASRVYGQGGNFNVGTANNGGASANSLNSPNSVFADSSGVYIADSLNHRVLFYPGTSTTATRVYGQNGSFTSITSNSPGLGPNSLHTPYAVYTDSYGVYVDDSLNNRILFYPGTSTTATRVYGQSNSLSGNTANNGGISASSMSSPAAIFGDATGIYMVDLNNNRMLFY